MVTWGKHPLEGFNSWGDSKSFGYMMCLFLQGPVIPTGKKLDFGHTGKWVRNPALLLTGCVSFPKPRSPHLQTGRKGAPCCGQHPVRGPRKAQHRAARAQGLQMRGPLCRPHLPLTGAPPRTAWGPALGTSAAHTPLWTVPRE